MIYSFDDCSLDVAGFDLRKGGKPVSVEPQVFELLTLLVSRHGQAVARDEIIETVWSGRIVSDATISSRIKAARKAIGDDGTAQRLIRTIYGRGFRFVGAVKILDQAAGDKAAAATIRSHDAVPEPARLARRLAAILVADVAGYSRLMAEDETGTLGALKAHRCDLFDPETARHGGRIVRVMGDGVLVEFASAFDAVECAIAIQRAQAEASGRIALRIGINIGDVIVEGDDVYGDGVNVAARLEALAEPGGICISRTVHDTISGKITSQFEDYGLHILKNIAKPVHIYGMRGHRSSNTASLALSTAPPDRPSIAVLPFANLSGDKEQEYFSDGITEDIITDLSRVSQLIVIARNSTFSYRGRAVKVQQISADLGARFLVEGSVRKTGTRVRVTAQLIDGRSGSHVWADRYDRDMTDVFEVQDEIAKSIVNALKVAVAPKERQAIERIPTRNMEAYDFYLRGRQLLREMTKLNLESAREMFLAAVALDPAYAVALTGLADCDAVLYCFYSSDRGFLEAAIRDSKKALELDPGLAEAHASMGFALSLIGNDATAEREFTTAIEHDPMLHEAYWYFGLAKVMHGDLESAAHLFAEASRVRGDDLQSKMMLMGAYFGLGREADMLSAATETFAIAARRLELNPRDSRAAYIGAHALIHLKDKSRALEWAEIAARIDSTDPRTTYNLACAYSMLGENDKALDYLERSIKGGRPVRMLEWAEIDPDLANVRDSPRFAALMAGWREAAADAPSLAAVARVPALPAAPATVL